MAKISAERYHDFSAGHRVCGHESKCAFLHGHNYRVYFTIEAEALDNLGRVMDFGVIKTLLADWVEEIWDHKFLAYAKDAIMRAVTERSEYTIAEDTIIQSIVWTPFNPTAENMALYLLEVIGPKQLGGTGAILTKVRIEETRKCSATAEN